jgi:cysteine dioxygenase
MNAASLDKLIKALDAGPGRDGYAGIMRSIEVPLEELTAFASWNPKHYTRNIIVQREAYELLLICFEADQRSSIHDYDSEDAFIHPVQGSIREDRFELASDGLLDQVSSTVLGPRDHSHLKASSSIHRYVNVGVGRAMSLNLYARPLRRWKVYDERSGRITTQQPGSRPHP